MLKTLPCYILGEEPKPHQNFYPKPEPHKNDAAPEHWKATLVLVCGSEKKIDSALVHTGQMNEKWRNKFSQKIYQNTAQSEWVRREAKLIFAKNGRNILKKLMLPYKLTLVLKNCTQNPKTFLFNFLGAFCY
jgi:hypothetical protein